MLKFLQSRKIDTSRTKEFMAANEAQAYPVTRFNFINDHRGMRPGMMHVLMGTTGSGKTTMARAILADLSQGCKILYYSSEETAEQFQAQAGYANKINFENISFVHETDALRECSGKDDIEGFIKFLNWELDATNSDLLFFDNITTSVFYDQNKRAIDCATKLRAVMVQKRIPFFVVAHTGSLVRDGTWFDASNMRGFRSIANTAEYFYCLFRFRAVVGGYTQSASFIHVEKSMMHSNAKYIYKLFYDSATRDYTSEQPEDYSKCIEYLKKGK